MVGNKMENDYNGLYWAGFNTMLVLLLLAIIIIYSGGI